MGNKNSRKKYIPTSEFYYVTYNKNNYEPFIQDVSVLLKRTIMGDYVARQHLYIYLKYNWFDDDKVDFYDQVIYFGRVILEIIKIDFNVKFNVINKKLLVQHKKENIWILAKDYYEDLLTM